MLEDQFGYGVQFTNTPLEEGWVKALVNYDLLDKGKALKPRPGLQTVKQYIPATGINGFGTVIAAKEQHGVDNVSRAQLITIDKNAVNNDYDLKVITGSTTEVVKTPVDDSREDNIKRFTYATSDTISVKCTTPDSAEIHGMPLSNTALAKHAGVYAWNEQYYFFNADGDVVHTEFDDATQKYKLVTDAAKAITAKEAVTYGYNMLHSAPYTFSNTLTAAEGILMFQGMMPFAPTDLVNPCLTPLVNQTLQFEMYFSAPTGAKYNLVVEWRGGANATWNTIKTFDRVFSDTSSLNVQFSPPEENVILRITAYKYVNDVKNAYSDATLAVGFNFKRSDYGSTANISPKTYSVKTATGLTYWKNRLVAWGVAEDPTILFTSEINDPTYFPYPNNCEVFSEPIKYVVPFLEKLLVFTSSKLYMLVLNEDGLTWMRTLIQNNLSIADWDIHLIQTVKNMLFFRSGNYFYMMVPKATSATGELTLAAVSKPLYYFFDNFEKSVKEIIQETYDKPIELTLKQYYNYLDFEDVHNVYVFDVGGTELVNFDMLYNVADRSWRAYILGCTGMIKPFKQDMTQRGTLCMTSLQNTDKWVYQLMRYNTAECQDYYNVDYTNAAPITAFENAHTWFNWQYIDTGYREHMSNFKKRYRELQFVINNVSNKRLKFYTDFFIDGEQRKSHYTYQVAHNTDVSSPDYGLITVERVLSEAQMAIGSTRLGVSGTDEDAWMLDMSAFPDVSFCKIRFPVSGKGYAPRMLLISRNELTYELLNISWVYRQMYSR